MVVAVIVVVVVVVGVFLFFGFDAWRGVWSTFLQVEVATKEFDMPRVGLVSDIAIVELHDSVEDASFSNILGPKAQSAFVTNLQGFLQRRLQPVQVLLLGKDKEIVPMHDDAHFALWVKEARWACFAPLEAELKQSGGIAFLPKRSGIPGAVAATLQATKGPGRKAHLFGHSNIHMPLWLRVEISFCDVEKPKLKLLV